MNRVILIGRLTRDPEERTSQNGNPIARYTLAIDRNKGEADFINCIAFNKGAEFAGRYLRKGMKIAVEGHIQTSSYTKDDGTKVYNTDVIVDRHEFCESRERAATVDGIPQRPETDEFTSIDSDDDLPF